MPIAPTHGGCHENKKAQLARCVDRSGARRTRANRARDCGKARASLVAELADAPHPESSDDTGRQGFSDMNTSKPCSKCNINHDAAGRYCRPCRARYMQKWRKDRVLSEEQRLKEMVRAYARVYTKRGFLKQEPCLGCGHAETEKHHPDYSRPLHVIWLCRACHMALHAAERTVSHETTPTRKAG